MGPRARVAARGGHRAGVEAVSRVVEAAPATGVGILTLFAFSSDNWRRPREEVETLMRLLANYLQKETGRAVDQGVRMEIIGRRDRLDGELRAAIEGPKRLLPAERGYGCESPSITPAATPF